MTAVTETIDLIITELVTNSLQASARFTESCSLGRWTPAAPPIRVWLRSDDRRVLVQVWDSSNRIPARQQLDVESESGRGLWLVEAVSDTWGTHTLAGTTGKIVWAMIAQ